MKTPNWNQPFNVAVLFWAVLILVSNVTGLSQSNNYVLSLDGNGSQMTIPSAAELQNPDAITIEAWVYSMQSESPDTAHWFINKGDGADGDTQRTFEWTWLTRGVMSFAVYFTMPVGPNQPGYAEIRATVPENTWTHVAGVYDRNTGLRLYTNGILAVASTTYGGKSAPFTGLPLRQTTLPVVLGHDPAFRSYVRGFMDELRIWSVARSPQQILENTHQNLTGTETGLAAYWNFDNGTANDVTGHGHNGTLGGTAVIAPLSGEDVIHAQIAAQGPTNHALQFAGGNGEVEIQSSDRIQPQTHFTIETWIRPNNQQHTYYLNKGDGVDVDSQRTYELLYTEKPTFWSANGGLVGSIFTGTNGWTYIPTGTFKSDFWYHVAMVFSSTDGVLELFVNGQSVNKITQDTLGRSLKGQLLRTTSLPLRLGARFSGDPPVSGQMDELRIWSIARTSDAIQADMNRKLRGDEQGLMGYWNFETEALLDLTGGGHNGMLVGSPFPQIVPIPWLEDFLNRPPITATATAQVVNGFVVGATLTDGGYGYTNSPSVTITGGGGDGAKAFATINSNGVVTRITITNPGIGYTSDPNFVISSPPFPPRKVKAISEIINGFVVGIKITDSGFGYVDPPVVMLTGGGGSGATATATVVDGIVTGVTVTNPGIGYTSAPKVFVASPPFSPELSIEVTRVRVNLKVVLGRKYQIQSSKDLTTWAVTGPAFIAQEEELAQDFDVDAVGRFFRINQVP